VSPRLLSLLAAILLAICWSAPVRAQDEIVIPDFKGLTVAQATLRILDLGVLSEFVNDMSCTGTELIVSNQTPVAGAVVPKAQVKIVLFTATSVSVPDPSLFGDPRKLTPEQISAGLAGRGFATEIREEFGDVPFCYVERGWTRSFDKLSPSPGSPICRNKAITVVAYNDPKLQSQWHCSKNGFDCICP